MLKSQNHMISVACSANCNTENQCLSAKVQMQLPEDLNLREGSSPAPLPIMTYAACEDCPD